MQIYDVYLAYRLHLQAACFTAYRLRPDCLLDSVSRGRARRGPQVQLPALV